MASLYIRGQMFWIKYRTVTGELLRESTGFRVGVTLEKRRAEELRAQKGLLEVQVWHSEAGQQWDHWVPAFLHKRYGQEAKSLLRYKIAWRTIRLFLRQQSIVIPKQLTRERCLAYLDWRGEPDKRNGKYAAGHNTAVLELKVLGLIVKEALLRGYVTTNPCRELGIKREAPNEKPAFDAGHITMIRRHIATLPEGGLKTFLHYSFEIARYQGCRLSETWLNPQTDVTPGIIRFRAKGGKTHTSALHPALAPILLDLKTTGAIETYRKPKSPAKTWFNFLTLIGLKKLNPGCCFHSFRVTVATELAQKNVHEAKARRYLGHSSTTVHRIYQRLQIEDLQDATAAIGDKHPAL